MTVEIVLDPGGANELTIDDDEIQGYQPVKTHTGIGDFRATLAPNRALEAYAQRQNRLDIRINGTTHFTGYLIDVEHDTQRGVCRISADGVGKRLQETRPDYDSIGGPLTYNNISLVEALRDYWPRTPFTNFTVTDQSTTLVAEDQQLQEANTNTEWSNITSLTGTEPLVIQNNNLELAQASFTTEGEDADLNTGSLILNIGEYSGGDAVTLANAGETAEWDFSLDYTIPADNFAPWVRDDADDVDGNVGFTWELVHDNGNTYTLASIGEGVISRGILWIDWTDTVGSYTGPDLTPGDYTLKVTADTTGAGSEAYYIDVVAPLDDRFSWTFDNDNGGSEGFLDGPELYPDLYPFELDSALVSFNITSATVTSTWNDTSNDQAIDLSNDGGTTFQTFNNTSTATANFTDAGREALVKFTFSRYGTRSTATPQTGFNGQTVTDYILTIDGNDLVVIDDLELNRSHFDNLKTLHEYGNFNWVIEHDSGSLSSLVVSSFLEGDEVRAQPAGFGDPINVNPEVQSGVYFNSIFLQGALVGGSRVTAEIKDNDAIANDDREISPGVLRDYNVTTEAGADFRARSLLNAALSNNELIGSITVPPTMTDPGYAVPVDLGDGEENKTIEEVSLTEGTDGSEATFDFTVRTGFERDISDLRQNARDIGNNV